ncbi:MAG: phosphomannomutase/phosphoglucomutase [Bacilli bacterium]|nr:phosphomannomutase/phosphoglucomutase [Bacilli bacterium]
MDQSIFKEYDIRGTYPININEEIAYKIGLGYGSYIQEFLNENTCVVGRDNRLSSLSLSNALIKGITESGCHVYNYGQITTPMHYLTRHINQLKGIMVTASHNPKDDNGFKFSFDDLANARGQMIYDFRDYILKGKFLKGKGTIEQKNITQEYLNYMKKNIHMGEKKVKAVIDLGNGATTCIAKKVHTLFPNLEITYLCDENDGNFPNHHPDPAVEENMTLLKQKVIELKADVGIAYDGDGDRLGIVLENGQYISADQYMILIIKDLLPKTKNKTILYDVKCSKALEDEIIKLEGTPYCYRTGTSYTESKTKELNLSFGGEFSGHIFFNDRDYALGSGIYAGLRLMEILSKTNQSLSDILKETSKYYQTPEIKVPTTNELKFEIVKHIIDYVKEKKYDYNDIDGVRVNFDYGWALVRASNTGPNLTLRFEATTEEELEKLKEEFTSVVNRYL